MVEIGARFMDKVEAAVDEAGAGEEEEEEGVWPAEPVPEPPDEAGTVGWPMPEFCPLTIDGAVKESFLEALRKDDAPQREGEEEEGEALSPDSRPSSSKRQRPGTAPLPSSRSPYRNVLQVFQQCKQEQDVA